MVGWSIKTYCRGSAYRLTYLGMCTILFLPPSGVTVLLLPLLVGQQVLSATGTLDGLTPAI